MSFKGFVCDDSVSSSDEESDSYVPGDGKYSSQKFLKLQSASSRTRKNKCLSKNALIARENRKKKKMYIESIESEINILREANHSLKIVNKKRSKELVSLKREVVYLKSILANSSSIEKLLSGINKALSPNVIVKEESTMRGNSQRIIGPLLGDPMLSSSLNTHNTASSSGVQTSLINQDHNVEDLNDELPQSLEKKNLGRIAAHLPMDLQEEPER